MSSGISLSIEFVSGVPVVRMIGYLDHHSLPEFRAVISSIIDAGHVDIILDVSSVIYIDSGGVSGIVYTLKRLLGSGGRLRIAGCTPQARRKLDVCGLTHIDDTLVLCATVEESLEAL